MHDLVSGTTTPLTFDGRSIVPIWSPDSARITFLSPGGGLFSQAADGTGQAELLLAQGPVLFPFAWSPVGNTLLAGSLNPGTGADIVTVSLDNGPTVDPLVQTAGTDGFAVVSPNGRWVAYQSDDSGRMEVWVSPFPDVGGNKRLVSTGGGFSPVWAPSGDELFFRSDGVMMVVPVETDPAFAFSTPEVLFEAPYWRLAQNRPRAFDLSPDGMRFLMIREEPATDEAPNVPDFVFVEHWR